nr:uncharacterized protein CTRU02_02323 [Colletotrichum truncatum]KAF6798350.1 hypothetical protein CTRU02_02323 [Colletotrichum truncatum]
MELSGTRNRIKELLEDQTATRKEAEQCRAQFENKRQLSLVRQMQISILSRRIAKLEAGISASEVHRTEFGPADSQRNVLETTLGCIHWLHQRGSWMKKPKNALVAWPSWLNWF